MSSFEDREVNCDVCNQLVYVTDLQDDTSTCIDCFLKKVKGDVQKARCVSKDEREKEKKREEIKMYQNVQNLYKSGMLDPDEPFDFTVFRVNESMAKKRKQYDVDSTDDDDADYQPTKKAQSTMKKALIKKELKSDVDSTDDDDDDYQPMEKAQSTTKKMQSTTKAQSIKKELKSPSSDESMELFSDEAGSSGLNNIKEVAKGIGNYKGPSKWVKPHHFSETYRGDTKYSPNYDNGLALVDDEYKDNVAKVVERKKKIIQNELKSFFGTEDAVIQVTEGGKTRKKVICPLCKKHFDNVERHLEEGAKNQCSTFPKPVAKFYQSLCIRMFSYITTMDKHGVKKPTACLKHKIMVTDIKRHLKAIHGITGDKLEQEYKRLKDVSVAEVYRNLLSLATQGQTDLDEEDTFKGKPSPSLAVASCLQQKLAVKARTDLPVKKTAQMVKGSKVLTDILKKELKIEGECFFSYFETSEEMLNDFRNQKGLYTSKKIAGQHADQAEKVWKAVDPKKTMFPCSLANTNLLEDKWFMPLYKDLQINRQLPKEKRKVCLAAGTVISYLGSLKMLCTYSLERNVYIGLKMSDIQRLDIKRDELMKRIRLFKDDRKSEYDEWRLETLISPAMTRKWGTSDHIQSVRVYLAGLDETTTINESDAVNTRDYFMLQIAFQNACRSSNLMNITLTDVSKAVEDEQFVGAMVLRNKKYKTSMLYGDKIIVIPKDIFVLLLRFIKVIRPTFIQGEEDNVYLFITKNGKDMMESSNVSKCLTRSMKKAKVTEVFEGDSSVSCIRIRASVATELAGLGDEKIEVIANTYMKNKRDTTAKYYVKLWSQREAIRISMKCAEVFHLDASETEKLVTTCDELNSQLLPKEQIIQFAEKYLSCDGSDLSKLQDFLKNMRIPDKKDLPPVESVPLITEPVTSKVEVESLPYIEEVTFLETDWMTSKTNTRGVILAILYLVADHLQSGAKSMGKEVWTSFLSYADGLDFKYPYIDELKLMTSTWQSSMKDLLRYFVQKYSNSGSSDQFIQMRRAAHMLIRKAILEA